MSALWKSHKHAWGNPRRGSDLKESCTTQEYRNPTHTGWGATILSHHATPICPDHSSAFWVKMVTDLHQFPVALLYSQ
uniref:Uncharacterized protein n=1 Tax=Paramormyrops kingsleyae TaxID=1676925 RepID=A0A3B3R5I1_9TELE